MGHGFAMVETVGNYPYAIFRPSTEVNACVKQLLSCFHGGYLWLDTKVHVTVDFISQIIELPMAGVDPLQYFHNKDNEKMYTT